MTIIDSASVSPEVQLSRIIRAFAAFQGKAAIVVELAHYVTPAELDTIDRVLRKLAQEAAKVGTDSHVAMAQEVFYSLNDGPASRCLIS